MITANAQGPSSSKRWRGLLYGLLVDDALGVSYEFHGCRMIPPEEQIQMEPPARFQRARAGVPIGTRSDDGAQAIGLLWAALGRSTVEQLLARPS